MSDATISATATASSSDVNCAMSIARDGIAFGGPNHGYRARMLGSSSSSYRNLIEWENDACFLCRRLRCLSVVKRERQVGGEQENSGLRQDNGARAKDRGREQKRMMERER